MSKKNDETENQSLMEAQNVSIDVSKETFCALEEHAKTLNVTAPVFAAVQQYKGWSSGKRTEKSEFEKAVKDFLNAPIGGV
jgi:hypothetical protein